MNKESTFARFRQCFDYLKDNGILHKQSDLCKSLNIGKSHVSEFFNGKERYFTEGNLRRFARAYADYIDEEWLLIGEGQMEKPDKSFRPHFELNACPGFMCEVSDGDNGFLRPQIPGVRSYDFTIMVEDNSMQPDIKPGDLLACRKSDDRGNLPIGKICVIDGKDGAVVKVVTGADEEALALHSLNPAYNDYKVELSAVLGIAEVVGLVRIF